MIRRTHRGVLSVLVLFGVGVAPAVLNTRIAASPQINRTRPFGPGRCGPVDPLYARTANATGGQVFPLSPSETAGAAPLMAASFGTETVLWATGGLTSSLQTIEAPVDSTTSRIAFSFSTVDPNADMALLDPQGTQVAEGAPGVAVSAFNCVRLITIEKPKVGRWSVRFGGSGSFWLVVHAKSELALEDATFVRPGGRPGHEGLFRIPGQPIAGQPAMLRARVARDQVGSITGFDFVSMSGKPMTSVTLTPVTSDSDEEEFVGEITQVPTVPFRIRVTGLDRSGAEFQRVSGPAFRAETLEVIAPGAVTLESGRRTPLKVGIRNVGAPARIQVRALLGARSLPVEPAIVQIATGERRDVTFWADATGDVDTTVDIVVTAETSGDSAATNSAVFQATFSAPR